MGQDDDIKNDYSEHIPESVKAERTREKTLGEAKAHEIRPEELDLAPPRRKRPALMLAEFASPADCIHGAEKLRDGGYERFDAHTPFPVHGMDRAMGLPDSKL